MDRPKHPSDRFPRVLSHLEILHYRPVQHQQRIPILEIIVTNAFELGTSYCVLRHKHRVDMRKGVRSLSEIPASSNALSIVNCEREDYQEGRLSMDGSYRT
jgi:hypothetical protein